ncbi:putative aspartate aminotransferase, cytoplasmic 2 isoform B [Alligator mississippiensis]|uniref:aspartate transaminase n=1 Tax=Alligator mississippiensis TaxID=8496 RepID=A0A151NBU2_ALLMI|nr:putative aspartate aminotransferase, cytoplasmic 2 isoform B [Alligator mississippiensis]
MNSPLPLPSLLSDEEKPVVVLWGCELNASTRKYIVKEEDDFLEHLVSLKTICLGAEAKDELNVVAVAAKNTYGDNTPMPIASLKLSVLPMATLDGFEFTPPVDFVLKSGTGPVYLHGQHVILKDYEEYEAPCCRIDTGEAWVCPTVLRTLQLVAGDPTRDYEQLPVCGLPEFTRAATELAIGRESQAILENRAGGVQTAGVTGALRIGAEFLRRWHCQHTPGPARVYIAAHQLDFFQGIFHDAGFVDICPYLYWDSERLDVALEDFLEVLESSPEGSIILLHGPEGTGLTPRQWEEVAQVMERKHLFPFFDIPGQGLASGDLDKDARALRHFVARGFELFCAQSFSRIFGLYDEPVGNLTVVARDNVALTRIRSQLEKVAAALWGSPTCFSARVIATVLNNPALCSKWKQSLRAMAEKIMLIRAKLKEKLRILGTPGSWEHITTQLGTHSFMGLLPVQVAYLVKHKHIYLHTDGQVSMCSINSHNMDYVAQSIHEAVVATMLGLSQHPEHCKGQEALSPLGKVGIGLFVLEPGGQTLDWEQDRKSVTFQEQFPADIRQECNALLIENCPECCARCLVQWLYEDILLSMD